jgi:hypothetical protein
MAERGLLRGIAKIGILNVLNILIKASVRRTQVSYTPNYTPNLGHLFYLFIFTPKPGSTFTPAGWMIMFCPASCNACELRDPKIRCDRQRLNISTEVGYMHQYPRHNFQHGSEDFSSIQVSPIISYIYMYIYIYINYQTLSLSSVRQYTSPVI